MTEVLEELAETFKAMETGPLSKLGHPVSVLQRFGYMCEEYLDCKALAESIYGCLKEEKFHPVVLSPSGSARNGKINNLVTQSSHRANLWRN